MNSKKYTFKSLLENTEIELIEIPKIQRDYAQGRKDKESERVRKLFLESIYDKVSVKEELTLDFIYGDISENKFIPLDGQQRLTTLFLLHWYIAKKENVTEEEQKFLKKFTYDTRVSSNEFCHELVKFSPFERKVDYKEYINISNIIEDQQWFPLEWKNDPTIQSMLVMIDELDINFKNLKNIWNIITNKINFYYIPINQMGEPDELYIKMNSRGKPLTIFEHFKAEFEKRLKEYADNNNINEEYYKSIFKKIDLNWTDILFNLCGKNKAIDSEFICYFNFVNDIYNYRSGNKTNNEKDVFEVIKILFNSDIKSIKEKIDYIEKSFDIWENYDINDFFNNYFTINNFEKGKLKIFENEINLLKKCCENYGEYEGTRRKFTLKNILFLFSINVYLINKNKIRKDEFIKRIRIVRNLIENSDDEIREERLSTLLSEVEEIMLYGVIPNAKAGSPGFNETQKEEENLKMKWLNSNSVEINNLLELEDNDILKGSIAIVGLENERNFEKFKILFNETKRELIDRTMLSLGDCTQTAGDNFFTGYKNNWDDYFHKSKKRGNFDITKNILNQLLDKINEKDNIENQLNEIIIDYLNNKNVKKDWRYYFVKYYKSLEVEKESYYNYIKNDNIYGYKIIKLNKSSLKGKNWNVFLYILFNEVKELYKDELKLGEWDSDDNDENNNGKLVILKNGVAIKCLEDKYIVNENGNIKEHIIVQTNGIDKDDRIEVGKNIIKTYFYE